MQNPSPHHPVHPGGRRYKQLVAIAALAIVVSIAVFLSVSGWGNIPLSATLTGSGALTRSDCFEMQRVQGRLTPECRQILFGSVVTATAWATAVPAPTWDPTSPTPTPKLPMGSRCLNSEQCSTGNCVMNPALDGGPSLLIGICGCRQRPGCLDADPACALPETPDMCICGNGQCEVGEKTSCPQDCRTLPSPSPSDTPSCKTCLAEGMPYLCQGGFTGGSFCNQEPGGTGADFTCVACETGRCVPEGQECSVDSECGTCGATCVGDGMTATEPPSIINGKCVYPTRPSASPIAMCDYAPPPEGCRYVPGPDYDRETSCGLVLQCSPDSPLPVAGRFAVVLSETIRVGDDVDVRVCGNTVSGPFQGWATITIDAGPTADVPTYLSYEFLPEDRGCQTFPGAIRPIRTGILKLSVQDVHFSDLDSQDPTMTETVTRTVLPPDEVVCPQDAKLCPDGSYVGRTAPNCQFAACPEETPNGACVEARGNVNCDERVDIADLAQLAHVLVGRASLPASSMGYRNADTNNDGKVDIADLAALASILVALPSVQ